jgi:CTX phage RstB protein
MKIRVVGLERAEGVSMKTGKAKPYAIGQIHAVVSLEERNGDGSMTKGAMGTSYQVDPELVKRIEHLPLPFEADLTVEDVMRFGKRESKVIDVRPLAIADALRPVVPTVQERKAA